MEKKEIKEIEPKNFYSKNMNYAFNVEYLENIVAHGKEEDSAVAATYNKKLLEVMNNDESLGKIFAFGKRQTEKLQGIANSQRTYKTMYPGLLIGLGNPHKTKKLKGEIQQGFIFDYVTGAPYYPGSSLKGVIRDVFDRALADYKAGSGESQSTENEYMGYLTELILEKTGKELSEEDIKFLLDDGFEGVNKSMCERDKFFDGYIVKSELSPNIIIGLDNITPHPDILKNPKPITMIRIMPGTCITFSMNLHEVKADNKVLLTKEQKEEVYYQIIEDFGIGAKTNVGYGILERVKCEDSKKKKKEILWVAMYTSRDVLEKLEKTTNREVVPHKKWLKESDIAEYAKEYEAIAVPSSTKQPLLDKLKENFKVVYRSKSKDKVDYDWEELK